ncbi:MAG: uroporphyrinogen-III C-methyltransferase [Candidatus Dormibacteria bacterium]
MTYPVSLNVAGRRCVVVGGEELALGRVRDLLDEGAVIVLVAPRAVADVAGLAASGDITWERRRFQSGDLSGALLAIDTTGDEDVNAAVWEEGNRLGVLVNVVDRPERCHFFAPAVVRRGALTLAVSTSGESPFLAGAIRARLERTYGVEWGAFVSLVGRVRRRLRTAGTGPEHQLHVYRRLMASEVRAMLRDGRESAAEFEAGAMAADPGRPRAGRVALVGAGPGDPGLLTIAGRELLSAADVVFHDALVEPATLGLCGPGAELVDVGKRGGRSSPDQEGISARMVEAARAGLEVVRLKGGDPFMFGRGGEELAALTAAGLEVAVIPGVSAALAAPAAAGIPLTLRGTAASVAFVTARGRDAETDLAGIQAVARTVDTLVVLMPLSDIDGLAAAIAEAVGGERPAALISRATTRQEHVIRASVGGIAAVARREEACAPATLVVGEVARAARAPQRSVRAPTRP